MSAFSFYIQSLAEEHVLVRHSENECHFSDMASDLAQKLRSKMNYPCVAIDAEGFSLSGSSAQRYWVDAYTLYVVDHIRDTGDQQEVRATMDTMKGILRDFLGRMMRDKQAGVGAVSLWDPSELEGFPVVMKDMALYGWGVSVLVPNQLNSLLCNEHFDK